jgi:two-component system sensor histidine kinase RegB
MADAPSSPLSAERIQFGWLVRLRWVSILGQAIVIGVGEELGFGLPLAALGGVIALEAALNLGAWLWLRREPVVRPVHVAGAIAADLLLFTALLYLSGGPSNPFSFLYLVHLALAAVMLPPRLGWTLVALSLACSAALFIHHVPLGGMGHTDHAQHAHHAGHGHGGGGFDWHLRGMWVALGVAASFIVYFLRRVALELAERERQLALARERIVRSERLASLATLAAGAAHELGSPLGTIAVAARELERSLATSNREAPLQEDARLIRAEVDRCRRILDELAANAGGPPGAAAVEIPLSELVARALERFADTARVAVSLPTPIPRLRVPRLAVEKALSSLVHNALLATASGVVRLSAVRQRDELAIEVADDGPGMPPEVLVHATDPFFSTREAGAGMGLGLFLATSVVEQLGGRLELESHVGRGTRARLVLPSSTLCDDLPHSRAADAA